MPLHNQITKHVTPTDKTAVNDSIDDIDEILRNYTVNLTPEERQKYGSIDEKNKLFANKIMDYRTSEPGLCSPQVDWTEFEADYADRVTIEAWINRLNSMVVMLRNTKILHDYDNYHNGLVDYKYTQYMAGSEAGGYEVKRDELSQFFKQSNGEAGGEDSAVDGGGTPPEG
ncbi:MAG: hypothetical protein GC192_13555 [Bacteroidetes bacterium]|nr:hypothetical protein [Bacteroidota bacterium]